MDPDFETWSYKLLSFYCSLQTNSSSLRAFFLLRDTCNEFIPNIYLYMSHIVYLSTVSSISIEPSLLRNLIYHAEPNHRDEKKTVPTKIVRFSYTGETVEQVARQLK